jgi:hypothetical protein
MLVLRCFADQGQLSVSTGPNDTRAEPASPSADVIVLDVVEISREAVILQTCQGNELVLMRYFPEVKPLLPGGKLNVKV